MKTAILLCIVLVLIVILCVKTPRPPCAESSEGYRSCRGCDDLAAIDPALLNPYLVPVCDDHFAHAAVPDHVTLI